MGLDLMIQPFRAGDSCEVPSAPVRSVLETVAVTTEPGFVRIRIGSACADVYADLDGETLSGLVVSRSESGTEPLIVELAKAARAVILIPGGPTLLTEETQERELPAELAEDVRLAELGNDLVAAIAEE